MPCKVMHPVWTRSYMLIMKNPSLSPTLFNISPPGDTLRVLAITDHNFCHPIIIPDSLQHYYIRSKLTENILVRTIDLSVFARHVPHAGDLFGRAGLLFTAPFYCLRAADRKNVWFSAILFLGEGLQSCSSPLRISLVFSSSDGS